ncbi:MAG: DUF2726 domain-containing protein [Planctomycetes bacterium]|nr:DUF2726 domain-containing protein [Planctomycetota bacterium]
MKHSQPPGCVTAILALLGIRLGPAEVTREMPYRKRDDFLSAAELSFYRVLRLVVKGRVEVLAKVNLADIVFVARPHENQAYRNKIDRKHVDFLCCHPTTMKPLFGIELDDRSHQRLDRVERDHFVDQVFQVAGLPLVRCVAKAAYEPNLLLAELAPYLSSHDDAPPIVVDTGRGQSPLCPKCAIPMVRRTASKGQNAGRQFWGCSNYPRCKELIG